MSDTAGRLSVARVTGATGAVPRVVRLGAATALAACLVGGAATILILVRDRTPDALGPVFAGTAAVMVGSLANLLVRFWRWRFMMRRLGVRAPLIPELGVFVGSFAWLPVPLGFGQLVARVRASMATVRSELVVLAFAWERLLDGWALGVMVAVGYRAWGVLGVLLLVWPVGRRVLGRVAERGATWAARILVDDARPFDAMMRRALRESPALSIELVASLVAWAVPLLAWSAVFGDGGIEAGSGAIGSVAMATLVGAASPLPMGAGIAGWFLVTRLERAGVTPIVAATATMAWRFGTVWFSAVLGGGALTLMRGRRQVESHHDHFDAIDACYDAWLPTHYRRHLVVKKAAPMIDALGSRAAPIGLDVGCGRGWYVEALRRSGARMVGVDTSTRQLAAARSVLDGRVALVQATALELPFRAAAFDFAYAINVLHHLPGPACQREALEAMARVVRPGGFLFVHEMSVVNPVFRFYLSYVFPLVKGIEEGTEYYLDPRALPQIPGLSLRLVQVGTFIPDFVPSWSMPAARRLEAVLERTWLARWGAHFVATYERLP